MTDTNKELDPPRLNLSRYCLGDTKVICFNEHYSPCAGVSDLFQVLVPKRSEFNGKMIEVEIYEAGKHFLKGRPVEDSRPFTPSIAQPLQKGAVSGLTQVRGASSLKRCGFIDQLRSKRSE